MKSKYAFLFLVVMYVLGGINGYLVGRDHPSYKACGTIVDPVSK